MENGNNYYTPQQPWMQQPAPPERPSNGWIKWVIIAIAVLGLIVALVLFVANLGSKFGKTINDVASSTMTKADSLNNIYTTQHYEQLLEKFKSDSANVDLTNKLNALKSGTDSMLQMMDSNMDGFNDSIRNEGGLSLMDKKFGHNYFIRTGRAEKMKEALMNFRERSILDLPESEQDNSLRGYLLIDDVSKNMEGFIKEFTKWENLNFNQPALTIRMNVKTIKEQVKNFEREMLNHYDNSIVEK